MADIDSISESAPIDIEVSGAQGPRGRDAVATVVTSNLTAANDGVYNVVSPAVIADPTGVNGKGYTVFVISGTATVGGAVYSTEGTFIRRYFKSGTWYSIGTLVSQTLTASLTVNGGGNELALLGFINAEIECEGMSVTVGAAGGSISSEAALTFSGVTVQLAGAINLITPAVTAYTAVAGQILTLTNAGTGGVEFKYLATGPYANDAAAASGGVDVGAYYYTADGSVKRRMA